MSETPQPTRALASTPLHEIHLELGGKMVPFAGYDMPVQYRTGIKAEHLHTRRDAGLFDVAHMGQLRLDGPDRVAALEALVPNDIAGLPEGGVRYSFFTNEAGGILDDLMITNAGDHLYLVVNAACKDADVAHLQRSLTGDVRLSALPERAMLALQGPKAATVLARFLPAAAAMSFMTSMAARIEDIDVRVSRSGYTGEDGFEISLPIWAAVGFARRLLGEAEVAAIGLGARDSLRLEAGLCLYGHDIDETTTPIEAGLAWAIQKRRRADGGFPGARVILDQLKAGPARKRVGLRPVGRMPAREGAEVLAPDSRSIGRVTSGGFGPSVDGPVAMGYLEAGFSLPETEVLAIVRGKRLNCKVVELPFVLHNFHRG